MNTLKRFFQIILVLAVLAFLFRGWLYRTLVSYETLDSRPVYTVSNPLLADYINNKPGKDLDAEVLEILRTSLKLTTDRLSFSGGKCYINPNQLIDSKKANCVGYASFFAASCNYLFMENKLEETWVAQSYRGQLYFLGVNVHRYFSSPFFKDHDFVIVKNKTTGESLAFDPSITDHLFVERVTLKKP